MLLFAQSRLPRGLVALLDLAGDETTRCRDLVAVRGREIR